jgi:hypothetical protein
VVRAKLEVVENGGGVGSARGPNQGIVLHNILEVVSNTGSSMRCSSSLFESLDRLLVFKVFLIFQALDFCKPFVKLFDLIQLHVGDLHI